MTYESLSLTRFDDGREKNGFWIYKTLNNEQKHICQCLANGGGLLGWNERSIKAAHIKKVKVGYLVEQGVIRKTTLFEMAKNLVENETDRETKAELNKEGGFLALTSKRDRLFFYQFDLASDIVQEGEKSNQEIRYQIAKRELYDFVRMISR